MWQELNNPCDDRDSEVHDRVLEGCFWIGTARIVRVVSSETLVARFVLIPDDFHVQLSRLFAWAIIPTFAHTILPRDRDRTRSCLLRSVAYIQAQVYFFVLF